MKIKMKWQAALVLVALLAVAGCENDAVAPHDDPPALSAGDTAIQAGLVTMASTVVGAVILDPDSVNKDAAGDIFFDNADGVTGVAHLDYYVGGPKGELSTSEVADYAHLYTDENAPLLIELGLGGMVALGFDLSSTIDQKTSEAVISGGGSFTSGPYTASFAMNDVAVALSDPYPNDGTVVFVGLFYEVTAYCDGTNIAVMEVTDGPTYELNLDTGAVEEITGEE